MTKIIKHGLKAGSVAEQSVAMLRATGHLPSANDIAVLTDQSVQNVCSALSRLSRSGFVTPSEGTWPRQYDLGPRAKL